MVAKAKILANATIGNVGPGFDVLGLAIDGLGDVITVELTEQLSKTVEVTGRDADLIPKDPSENVASIAANKLLNSIGDKRNAAVSIERCLPLSGGLGASAAASVGGALGAAIASEVIVPPEVVLKSALFGEETVAGRHLDNIAPCFYGGLCVVRDLDSLDVVRVPIKADWWVVVVTPDIKIETKTARGILDKQLLTAQWTQQMANTSSLLIAFIEDDEKLAKKSLVDLYAEPKRSKIIPKFDDVKKAAIKAGAMGTSISGAGPTIFALTKSKKIAENCAKLMVEAFGQIDASKHIGQIAQKGAHLI